MSSKSFFVTERRVRKQRLMDLINERKDVSLRKLKALFSLQTGLTFKKIEEYLYELEEAGVIEVLNGELVWKEEEGKE